MEESTPSRSNNSGKSLVMESNDLMNTNGHEEQFFGKRSRDPSRWHKNIVKRARQSGIAYNNIKGKEIPALMLQEECKNSCRLACREKLSDDSRIMLFQQFWSIDSHERKW